jgi:hypothetical protein
LIDDTMIFLSVSQILAGAVATVTGGTGSFAGAQGYISYTCEVPADPSDGSPCWVTGVINKAPDSSQVQI